MMRSIPVEPASRKKIWRKPLLSRMPHVLTVLLLAVVALGACKDDDEVPSQSPEEQIADFLASQNITDAQTTPSGLVYVINEPGSDERPNPNSSITINYRGYLTDGTTFDQTTGSPRTFPLRNLIEGWQEGLQLVGRGGDIQLLIPPSLGYGNNPPPGTGITRNSVIVFDIELIDFSN